MCGIFGAAFMGEGHFAAQRFGEVGKKLFTLTGSRGKDASGLALLADDRIAVVKRNAAAKDLLKTSDYKALVTGRSLDPRSTVLIGHSRMVTDGSEEVHINNQPLMKNGMVVIHNGIVVNQSEIWQEFPGFKRETGTDTEVIPTLLGYYLETYGSLVKAVRELYRKIEGVATIGVLFANSDYFLMATNNGSLYTAYGPGKQSFFFASERYMLKRFFQSFPPLAVQEQQVRHMEAGEACLVNTVDLKSHRFKLSEDPGPGNEIENCKFKRETPRQILDVTTTTTTAADNHNRTAHFLKRSGEDLLEDNCESIDRLQRCTRCLLPETFPFITFDEQGVCSVCRYHKKVEYKGIEALKQLLAPFKKNNRGPDIIVPLSGGRDSSFTLHYVKTQLGMNPVAYTYDWGMVTDLARRNISRVTAKLGVEHILVSADIKKKRRFIRENVNAWLKRPRLGTVPLFMAGDKQFFYYANILKKQTGVNLMLFGMNPLESGDFKVGFTGIREKRKKERFYQLSAFNKLRLLFYYAGEYFLNPAFINRSVLNTLGGYISYYFISHDYHIFYEYFPWEEDLVVRTIIDAYDWETAPDTDSTWRIGDGTAAFYNYIYYTVAGFSENDTFRSNQVRQGLISREKAMEKVKRENRPRFEAIKWYCDANGIDFEHAVTVINAVPKLYNV